MSEVKTSNTWLLSCLGLAIAVCAMLVGIVYAATQAYQNLAPTTKSIAPSGTTPKVIKNAVLGPISICRKIKNDRPFGMSRVFSSSDQVFLYMPISKKGRHRVVVEFSKKYPRISIRTPISTGKNWIYCWAKIIPFNYRDPVGMWKAKIHVDGRLEQELEFEVRR